MDFITFDIECTPNFFLVNFKKNGVYYKFTILNDEIIVGDFKTLHSIYKSCLKDVFLVSYNGNNYDIPLLRFYIENHHKPNINALLKGRSDELIPEKSKGSNKEENKSSKEKRPFIYNKENSVDLMELLFNKPETAKSLKLLGCAIKHPKLQDLPYPHTHIVKIDEVKLFSLYCGNDVEITEKVFLLPQIQQMIDIRKSMKSSYNLTNQVFTKSDSSADNLVWKALYEKDFGKTDFYKMGTDRGEFMFSEALTSKVCSSFVSDVGKNIVEVLSQQKFIPNVKLDYPAFEAFGLTLQFGKGGLHSEDKPTYYNVDMLSEIWGEKVLLKDWDISSLYPSVAIIENISPLHIGEYFVNELRYIRDTRLNLKSTGKGKTPEANTLKLRLNSAVGKFSSEFSFLRDDLANLKVCLTGQLLLTCLIERLYLNGFKVISSNTDGIVTIIPESKLKLYEHIVDSFALEFGYEGEYNEYTTFAQKDVNNYIAIQIDGKSKVKGIFDNTIYLDKGYIFPVIQNILRKYYEKHDYTADNITIKDRILSLLEQETDVYDFCIAQKIGKQFDVYYGDEQIQHSVRSYVSLDGKEITKRKIVVDKKTGLDKISSTSLLKNRKMTLFNDYFEVTKIEDSRNPNNTVNELQNYNIDYDYYVNEIFKIIKKIKLYE